MLRYYPWDFEPNTFRPPIERVLIPKLPTPIHEVEYECGECGMVFKGAMGYVCSNPRCPVFPVITCNILS